MLVWNSTFTVWSKSHYNWHRVVVLEKMTRDGSTTNLSYTNNSNRLTNDGSQSLTYDAAGNQTGKGTESWVYDPRGLISQYRQSGSTIAAYTYDYRSLRSKKALTGAETVVFLYDLQGQLIAEYEDGSLKREYVWLNGAPLAQIDAGESITWFTTDHLFTPRLGTDSSKESVWQWDSYAFGETEPYLPTGSSGSMPTVNLRFPGQYSDSESARYYNWHRYYDVGVGRYVTSDPIGLRGGPNTFGYSAANPNRFVDPAGLFTTPAEGLLHYMFGGGESVNQAFSVLNISGVQPTDFDSVKNNLPNEGGCCSAKKQQIYGTYGYSLPGIDLALHGNVELNVRGYLVTKSDCSWCFRGRVSASSEIYNFDTRVENADKDHRSWRGELSTLLGAMIPGDPYRMNYIGSKLLYQCGP